jgi:GR25 family glycosyltransferase involved in LPS biosynthesis
MHPNNFFSKIFCINMKHRTDRREYSQKLFEKLGLIVDFIPAYNGRQLQIPELGTMPNGHGFNLGGVGCSLTHMHILRMAKYLKLPNFLILEDDVVFSDDFIERFTQTSNYIPADWGVLYLGANHMHWPAEPVNDHWGRCRYSLGAYACAVRAHCYDLIIDRVIDVTKANDVHLAELSQDSLINSYVAIPHMAWVLNDYSDIQQREMDYSHLIDYKF